MKKYIIIMLLFTAIPVICQDVALTIYNSNLALVREVRSLQIAKGVSEISFTDVAAHIDPTSVHMKSLTSPGRLHILEQNYEYDLVSAVKIMQKYIDQTVNIVMTGGEVFMGTLLSVSGNDIVIKGEYDKIQIIKGKDIQHFDFPALPDGLVSKPTLNWLVNNNGATKQKTEIDYLTSNIAWNAEYVGVVNESDTELELSGWVSINNKSGKSYHDATLKLIAGEIHRVQKKRVSKAPVQYEAYSVQAAAPPQFNEKEFFEYHMYTMQRKTTVKDNQIKQVALFPSSSSHCKKIYHYDPDYYSNKIRVLVELENSKGNGLGIPLPEGKVRVYKADSDETLQFIGEDSIDHTPRNEKLRLFLGNAFDVIPERTQVSHAKISRTSYEDEWELKLRNHKKEDIVVTVTAHANGTWKVKRNSHSHKKKDASTFEFKVPVKADSEAVLTYTIFYKY